MQANEGIEESKLNLKTKLKYKTTNNIPIKQKI